MKFLSRLVIFALGIMVGLFLVEGGLHGLEAWRRISVRTEETSPRMVDPDPWLGWVLRPGSYREKTSEWDTTYRINSKRMHDVPPAPVHKGMRVVVALGNSHTMASGMPLEKTWPKALERDLNARGGSGDWRVMNFGVAAYSIGQSYLHLMRDALSYHPKTVILAFTLTSDIYDTLHPGKGGFCFATTTGRAFFMLTPRGKLFLNTAWIGKTLPPAHDKSWQGNLKFWLDAHSRIYTRFKRSRLAIAIFRHLGASGRGLWPNLEYLSNDLDETQRYAWSLDEAILTKFQDELHARGIRFVLLILPYYPQVYDSVWNQGFAADSHYDRFAPNRKILEICKKHGMECDDLTEVFEDHARRGEVLHFPVDGHLNAQGHERVARELTRRLEEIR